MREGAILSTLSCMTLLSTDTALLLSALKSIDPMQDSAAGRRPLENSSNHRVKK
jgi:hypothetical protein